MPKVVSNLMQQDEKNMARWGYESNFCSKCGAWKGQLGLEPDFNLFIKHLADIFDEVKRVLKKDGTCWVNLGDTYSGSPSGLTNKKAEEWDKKGDGMFGRLHNLNTANRTQGTTPKPRPDLDPKLPARKRAREMVNTNIQAKCLTCIPERFIIEMINRGWILRNKIIWHKPNHMPTSVKDRFANSWEYLFMFSKSKKYYFDLDAVREPHKWADKDKRSELGRVQHKTGKSKLPEFQGGMDGVGYNPKGKNPDDVIINKQDIMASKNMNMYKGFNKRYIPNPKGTIPDDFFDITTRGYPEAHFAVFPEALVERPIKTTKKNAIIMDIFAGSGTTLKVARRLNRDAVGIEIKEDYVNLIKKRLFNGNQPLFDDFEIRK